MENQNAGRIDPANDNIAEKLEVKPSSQPKVFAEWMTPAYRQTEKSKGWYAFMGSILFFFIAYDLYTGGWVVSITMLILAGVYYLSESKPAPIVRVSVSDHGVRFGAQFFDFSQIKSFWIINNPEIKLLYLSTFKGVSKQLSIMIPDDVNIAKLREYLLTQVAEEEGKKEAFSDQLIRNLGL